MLLTYFYSPEHLQNSPLLWKSLLCLKFCPLHLCVWNECWRRHSQVQLRNPRSIHSCSSCLGLEPKSEQGNLIVEEMTPPFCLQTFQRLGAECLTGWACSTSSPQVPQFLEEWSLFISSSLFPWLIRMKKGLGNVQAKNNYLHMQRGAELERSLKIWVMFFCIWETSFLMISVLQKTTKQVRINKKL